MQKVLLKKIIKEEIKRHRKDISSSLTAIRKRITLAVAREITRQSTVSECYWNIFVAATEAESGLWMFLALASVGQDVTDVAPEKPLLLHCVVNTRQIEQLLLLYERWERMCEFLMDEYDRFPPEFKKKNWTMETLSEIASHVSSTKEATFSDFAERETTVLAAEHFPVLKGMIDWVRFVALGEESYRTFMSEMHEALKFVGQHPHFARRPKPGK
jgi:hypothetical protein